LSLGDFAPNAGANLEASPSRRNSLGGLASKAALCRAKVKHGYFSRALIRAAAIVAAAIIRWPTI